MRSSTELRQKYLREELLPTLFCSGCGNGQILNYTIRAIDDLNISQDNLVFVSGIGCSSRLPAYIEADGIHTTHGRAIAFATGIKITNPDLNVIVFTGDGDLAAIGLNHFLQAVRRNIGITVICVNNETYGMTGGQLSPTTPVGYPTITSPYQNIEFAFNLSFLAKAAGAPYVARWTTANSRQVINSIKKGLQKKGFSFIEIISPCPVSKKQFKNPKDYLNFFLNETVRYSSNVNNETSARMFKDLNECFTGDYLGKIIIGEIVDVEKPSFHELYKQLKERSLNEFWKNKAK
ncbi:2-oxoglutarate synthase [miscellaneous Crenarchaeota group archaeon SMTZ-80]|nr:MAG: 2-oxoglutarate synthase [miscellaneous Crenarchaeota group archaeon SMTZ-80]